MIEFASLCPDRNSAILCVAPILYCAGGIGGAFASVHRISLRNAWLMARTASAAMLLFSLACCCDAALHAGSLLGEPCIDSLARFGALRVSFRFDLLESLMLLLVTFLGWVIVGFSRAYMAGDAKEASYIGSLMRTLAAVSLLVSTNSLIVFLAAWILTSLSLHGLLTLYPNRQAAVIAAHKKFLASRLGDLTLLSAVLLLGLRTGSFEIDQVTARMVGSSSFPGSIHAAAWLLALSAIVKCAQLPLHGWLIQVMEAPTPVSALLHAGVVNLGGFMLIRLAPVLGTTPAAQGLLVVAGCFTAIVASLVMTTRISIKVHLAWSTCAQMGFMLMECGLGLYDLAFLHLMAHSLYKAHAFLASGETVNQAKLKRTMPATPTVNANRLVAGVLCALLAASLLAMLWRHTIHLDGATLFCFSIVALAVSSLFAAAISKSGRSIWLALSISAIAIAALYFSYEALFSELLPLRPTGLSQPRLMPIFSMACFLLLYGIQAIVRIDPLGSVAAALYPWFYAGFYLDEIFTRATFRLWPADPLSAPTARRDAAQPFEAEGASV